jgi:DeoR family transcriptional regulator of aga operon
VGSLAEEALLTMTADKLFLGVDGIHFKYGLTTPNLMEGRVNKLMIKIAHEVIVVADSSKFGKRSMSVISRVEEIDKIITDKKIQNDDLNRLRELGIDVILV